MDSILEGNGAPAPAKIDQLQDILQNAPSSNENRASSSMSIGLDVEDRSKVRDEDQDQDEDEKGVEWEDVSIPDFIANPPMSKPSDTAQGVEITLDLDPSPKYGFAPMPEPVRAQVDSSFGRDSAVKTTGAVHHPLTVDSTPMARHRKSTTSINENFLGARKSSTSTKQHNHTSLPTSAATDADSNVVPTHPAKPDVPKAPKIKLILKTNKAAAEASDSPSRPKDTTVPTSENPAPPKFIKKAPEASCFLVPKNKKRPQKYVPKAKPPANEASKASDGNSTTEEKSTDGRQSTQDKKDESPALPGLSTTSNVKSANVYPSKDVGSLMMPPKISKLLAATKPGNLYGAFAPAESMNFSKVPKDLGALSNTRNFSSMGKVPQLRNIPSSSNKALDASHLTASSNDDTDMEDVANISEGFNFKKTAPLEASETSSNVLVSENDHPMEDMPSKFDNSPMTDLIITPSSVMVASKDVDLGDLPVSADSTNSTQTVPVIVAPERRPPSSWAHASDSDAKQSAADFSRSKVSSADTKSRNYTHTKESHLPRKTLTSSLADHSGPSNNSATLSTNSAEVKANEAHVGSILDSLKKLYATKDTQPPPDDVLAVDHTSKISAQDQEVCRKPASPVIPQVPLDHTALKTRNSAPEKSIVADSSEPSILHNDVHKLQRSSRRRGSRLSPSAPSAKPVAEVSKVPAAEELPTDTRLHVAPSTTHTVADTTSDWEQRSKWMLDLFHRVTRNGHFEIPDGLTVLEYSSMLADHVETLYNSNSQAESGLCSIRAQLEIVQKSEREGKLRWRKIQRDYAAFKASSVNEIARIKGQVKSLTETRQTLKETISAKDRIIEHQNSLYKLAQEENARKEKKNKEQAQVVNEQLKEIEALKLDLFNEKKKAREQTERMIRSFAPYKSAMVFEECGVEEQQELAATQIDLSNSQSLAKKLQAEVGKLQEANHEIPDLRVKLEEKSRKQEKLTKVLKETESSLNETRRSLGKASADCKHLKSQNDELCEQLAITHDDVAKSKRNIAFNNQVVAAAMKTHKENNAQLETKVRDLVYENFKLEGKLASFRADLQNPIGDETSKIVDQATLASPTVEVESAPTKESTEVTPAAAPPSTFQNDVATQTDHSIAQPSPLDSTEKAPSETVVQHELGNDSPGDCGRFPPDVHDIEASSSTHEIEQSQASDALAPTIFHHRGPNAYLKPLFISGMFIVIVLLIAKQYLGAFAHIHHEVFDNILSESHVVLAPPPSPSMTLFSEPSLTTYPFLPTPSSTPQTTSGSATSIPVYGEFMDLNDLSFSSGEIVWSSDISQIPEAARTRGENLDSYIALKWIVKDLSPLIESLQMHLVEFVNAADPRVLYRRFDNWVARLITPIKNLMAW